jgi:hypothetical protein
MGPLIEKATRQDGSLNSRGFSLQLRVLRLGFLQDGDVGVGVFPEGEEVLIGGAGLGGVTLQVVSAGKAESGEGIEWRIREHGAMVEHFLKFSGGCAALSELKVGLSAHIGRVEEGTGPAGAANSPAGDDVNHCTRSADR